MEHRTTMNDLKANIPGYQYGDPGLPKSSISLAELELLKATVGFSAEDAIYLRMAGAVLASRTQAIVEHWRSGIIAGIPHLARHSRGIDGKPLPEYLARSNRRFEQWILDTCQRPYDQAWLDYQQEIALRHTRIRKNQTDRVESTAFIPLRDILGFIAVMNETIKPYLAADGHSADEVKKMHGAWCKSLQLQAALFAKPYTDPALPLDEW